MSKKEQAKLNYRFHNPNTPEATADFLIKLYVAYHMPELEAMVLEGEKEAADKQANENAELS